MPNEIRADMLKVKNMVSEVEIIIGKREGETELVNKLIDAQNLLTYCMSRLENAVVLPCKVGDTVHMPERNAFPKGKVSAIHLCEKRSHIMVDIDFHFRAKHYLDEYGINWFTSQEEPEQALKEGADNG